MKAYAGYATYAAVLALSISMFLVLPGVDLWVSGLFHDPQRGFPLAAWPPVRFVEQSIPWITWAIVVLVALAAVWLRRVGRPLWRFDRNALIFLVAAIAIGPGILVNTIMKDHWGRARPYQVTEFGGTKNFTPAPLLSDQCERNCSFVSGHAALGFSLVCFAFLLPLGRARRVVFDAVLGFGALVGLARIASGRHFLSDVVDAGLLVIAITWLLHRWLVVHDGATPIIELAARLRQTPAGRRVLWAGGIVLFEFAAIVWIDRPVAELFHHDGGGLQPFFDAAQRFGIGWPYLAATGLAFAALRWGGRWSLLRRWDAPMRASAFIPGFIFAAVAASGIIADILKVVVGRTRPKLLFATGTYDFDWLGWRADHWSFPSGHAATAAALMTALWCLWPRPFWFYVAGAMLVATSRVVTGQHYVSDVVAGAVIAVLATRALAAWLLPQHAPEPAERDDAAPAYPAV
jgi:lipid A 4'-phosphatase